MDKSIVSQKSKHNGEISFWKFMFSIMIILLHVYLTMKNTLAANNQVIKYAFAAGSIGVEFFFIVSGYLMTKKAFSIPEKRETSVGELTFEYIIKKLKAFMPYVFVAYVCALTYAIAVFKPKTYQIINSVWDLLLLKMSGIVYYQEVLGIAWYISAMLISMIILYPLAVKYRKNFLYIVAPVIVIIIGGYIAHKYKTISGPLVWDLHVYKGLLRAFFEISLGALSYDLSERIKKINFNMFGKLLLTVIEWVGFASLFYVVNLKDAHNKYDFVMMLILFICISISFSGKTLLINVFSNKFFYYLEKLSLPMYLNQMWVMFLFTHIVIKKQIDISYYSIAGICVLLTIVSSIITIQIVNLMQIVLPKFKKMIISD